MPQREINYRLLPHFAVGLSLIYRFRVPILGASLAYSDDKQLILTKNSKSSRVCLNASHMDDLLCHSR